MESFFKLTVEQREKTGNSAARSLRREGRIPANYYYKGEENQNLSIDKKVLHKAIQSGQQVFEMELDGNVIYVTVKAAQYNPVTEEIIHIDLLRVRRDVKMKFNIPLNLVGDSVGANEGGIVSQAATSIELECLPTNVPDSIDVDISNLELNGSLTAADIELPDDTALVSLEDTTIAVCAPPKTEVEPDPVDDSEVEESEETVSTEPGEGAKPSGGDDESSSDGDSTNTENEGKSAD